MTYVKIGETHIPATVSGATRDAAWDYRHTKSITCDMTYEEAKATFVDGLDWYLVYQENNYINEQGETVTPDPVVYDNTAFELVMSITENRNGTVTVKMGKPTDAELLAIIMGG